MIEKVKNGSSNHDLEGREKFAFLPEIIPPSFSDRQKDVDLLPSHDEGGMGGGIVGIDLASSGAIEEISALTARSESRTLAINAPNKAVMIEAILSGADGSTHQEITPDEMMLVYRALEQECILVDSKRGQNPHFLVLPRAQISQKLELGKYRAVIEILNCWRRQIFPSPPSMEQLSVSNLASVLKLKSARVSLTVELSRLIESMSRKKTHNFLNLLQDLETFLEKWYFNAVFLGEDGTPNCSLAILRVNACQIRKVLHSNLQDSLKLWVRGGSHTLSQWLERVIVRFREIEVEWEKSRQLALSKAQSSLTAYSNLINRVKQEEDKLVCESALRALKIRYRELINAEALSIAGLMVSELVEELIRFRERINATDTLLTRFQEKIHQKMSEGRNFDSNSRLGEEIESARANAIRDCLVKKLGQSFAHWGNLSPTEHEIILEEVLRQAGKIALSTIVSRY